MDILSLIGITLGLVAVLGGSIAKGSGLGALWNAAAFLIVVLGTLGATLVQARLSVFMHGMRILPWAFKPPKVDNRATVEQIVEWSHVARKEGLLGLETLADEETDGFARKGLQLLVDGSEPQTIRQIMEADLDNREHFDLQGAKIFESMGIYAPTLGIVGAVMGLMAVMQNLADPSKLGAGIAAAFVATIYGIASANLLFLPVANKLKSIIQNRSQHQQMLMEGLIAIAEGENPRNIESKLSGFIHE
ncbi:MULTISPECIES: flagellar motor protein [Thioalkalivibrio]|uniref:Flagellar motor protein n=1 Tax=Thioalkalivibrio versutus TaxID=106634 RepID=A0A0G3G3M0_9GAMM|nr:MULTISPECIES: flagellar motor protein [Thioalkalivibrio]AKJ95004.1 flagellar motor protein [Thioalkalivibrio versutus]OOC50646.1 flagellar motor protein [Thioalkalivibrio versutus]